MNNSSYGSSGVVGAPLVIEVSRMGTKCGLMADSVMVERLFVFL